MGKNNKKAGKVTEKDTFTEDQRIQILIAQMNERYQAWHHLRDRSTQFTLWILGLAVASSWWLLQDASDNMSQKIAVTALIIILGGTAFYFLKSLAGGVRKNREVLIKIETALGVHSRGTIIHENVILPHEYKEIKPRLSAHFCTLYVLLSAIII